MSFEPGTLVDVFNHEARGETVLTREERALLTKLAALPKGETTPLRGEEFRLAFYGSMKEYADVRVGGHTRLSAKGIERAEREGILP
jgi:hypothetical protein